MLTAIEPGAYAVANRHLIYVLMIMLVVLVVIMVAVSVVSVRAINRYQERLMHRFEALREDTLATYIETQRAENARLVADTRAATAKMNVMADALWSGLQYNDRGSDSAD